MWRWTIQKFQTLFRVETHKKEEKIRTLSILFTIFPFLRFLNMSLISNFIVFFYRKMSSSVLSVSNSGMLDFWIDLRSLSFSWNFIIMLVNVTQQIQTIVHCKQDQEEIVALLTSRNHHYIRKWNRYFENLNNWQSRLWKFEIIMTSILFFVSCFQQIKTKLILRRIFFFFV